MPGSPRIKPLKPMAPKPLRPSAPKPLKPGKPLAARPLKPAAPRPRKPAAPRPRKPAGPRPASPRPKIARPAAPRPGIKKAFNRGVARRFSGGRQLSSAHRQAISEGLKRWHSAHGRGNYSASHRAGAIKHLNKRFTQKAAHHAERAGIHAAKSRTLSRKGLKNMAGWHRDRAGAHRGQAKKYQSLIIK